MLNKKKLLRSLSQNCKDPNFTRCFGDDLTDVYVKLFECITAGNDKEFSELLLKHVSDSPTENQGKETWEKRNSECYTLLQWSVFCKRHEIIKTLIKAKCDPAPGLKLASELGYDEVLSTIISSIKLGRTKHRVHKKKYLNEQTPQASPIVKRNVVARLNTDVEKIELEPEQLELDINKNKNTELDEVAQNGLLTNFDIAQFGPANCVPDSLPKLQEIKNEPLRRFKIPPAPPLPKYVINGRKSAVVVKHGPKVNELEQKLQPASKVRDIENDDLDLPLFGNEELHTRLVSKGDSVTDGTRQVLGEVGDVEIDISCDVEGWASEAGSDTCEGWDTERGQCALVDVPGETSSYETLSYQDSCGSYDDLNDAEHLIAAAANENFAAIQKLLDSGLTIPDQCLPDCTCKECKNIVDSLKAAKIRLRNFKALTSYSYMILKEKDPILASIRHSETLSELSDAYPENKDEFDKMNAKTSKFAVELLECCKSADEVKNLLTKERDIGGNINFQYPLLQLSVQLKQKKFVTHANCQHVLAQLWLGNLMGLWMHWSFARKMIHVLQQILFMPFGCFVEAIAPKEFFKNTLTVPLNRFIYEAFSYIIFLGLLIFCAVYEDGTPTYQQRVQWHGWVVITWIIALSIKAIYSIYIEYFVAYWTTWWTRYEMFTIVVFFASSICSVAGRYQAGSQKSTQLPIRLMVVGSGLYSIAITLACIRILQWFHLSRNFGHLIVSISRMTAILLKLLVVFSIVLFAFSISLYRIYKDFRPINSEASNGTDDKLHFMNYGLTVKILFWALFGQGEADYASIPDTYEWRFSDENKTTILAISSEDKMFTIVVGYLLWGLFHLAFIIILLNMLIAVMTNSYQNVQDNCDIEWKFARTKIWMNYFEDFNAIPAPFNLVSTARGLLQRIFQCCKTKKCCGFYDRKDAKRNTSMMMPIVQKEEQILLENMMPIVQKEEQIFLENDVVTMLVERYRHKKKLQDCRNLNSS